MRSLTYFLLFALIFVAFASALPLEGDDAAAAGNENAEDGGRSAKGFGCPNDYACHNHCRYNAGFRGGYCSDFLGLRCRCY